jgi:tetrapyrrole methylase family protein/MazG family protein
LTVVGLGPSGLDRLPESVCAALLAAGTTVVVRTLHHPAAAELAAARDVVSCDDLYEAARNFDAVYEAIADRVVAAAGTGPVIYAVPGSALVGERSVALVRQRAASGGIAVEVIAGESFLDLVYDRAGIDPVATGVQVLDGRALPDPLPLHLPTVITQVDRAEVLADVAAELSKVLPHDSPVTVLDRLGAADEVVEAVPLADLARRRAGPRLSLYLDPPPVGWHGLVTTNRRLRKECPWDREQTHHTLLRHLVEETYETVEAITNLPSEAPGGEVDYGAYAELEEELGDLLLQVVFHATLAAETGAFDVEEVAETIRRKLVHRHPHVFGDVEVAHAGEVMRNWERLKADEKARESLMDDIPASLPALSRADKMQRRAASAGFDWPDAAPVIEKLREEIAELEADLGDERRRAHELGDVLFTVVNLARHLGIDAEVALRQSADGFARRFRVMEEMAAGAHTQLAEMSLESLDALWERAKAAE